MPVVGTCPTLLKKGHTSASERAVAAKAAESEGENETRSEGEK